MGKFMLIRLYHLRLHVSFLMLLQRRRYLNAKNIHMWKLYIYCRETFNYENLRLLTFPQVYTLLFNVILRKDSCKFRI